jgi:hypothetical protein
MVDGRVMGFLEWLFGSSAAPEKAARLNQQYGAEGCWWDHPEVIPLAAGRGFTVDVVGESQWQENISAICGGRCEQGYREQVPAQLVFEANSVDPNAVGVMIDSRPVGWIPAARAAEFRAAITSLDPERRAVTCKAKIVGGWDGGRGDVGHFGVKLSLAWPLRIDPRHSPQ